MAAFAPVLITAGAAVAWSLQASPWLGAFIGLKHVLASLAGLRCLFLVRLSYVSNDSIRVSAHSLLVIALLGAAVLGTVTLVSVAVFAPYWWSVPLLGVAGVYSWGTAALHGWLYSRQWFDLMRSPE